MGKEQRLRLKINEGEEKWKLLTERLSRLEHDRILESNHDKRFGLEKTIEEVKAERKQVEQELHALELQFEQYQSGEFNEIFLRMCVCHSFKLSGLKKILEIFPTTSSVDPDTLPRIIEELITGGYVESKDLTDVHYIVSREKAEIAIQKLNGPSFCNLHIAWCEWFQSEFEKNFKVNDLAALLYHEAVCLKKCTTTGKNIIDYLKPKLQEHLWKYYSFIARNINFPFSIPSDIQQIRAALISYMENSGDQDKKREVTDYVQQLVERTSKLSMFDEILSVTEFTILFYPYLKY
jgi:hypothetical protein